MSNYTTELRFICETFAGLTDSEGYNSVNNIISKSRDKVFSFDYPIFDESYRSILETKIIKHYYTREICAETFGRWRLFLDARMNEIMPKYNKLYESELLEFNPLYDADYTRSGNRDGENTGTETNGSTDKMSGTIGDIGRGTNDTTGTIRDDGQTTNNMTGTVSDRGNTDTTRTDDLNTDSTSTRTDNLNSSSTNTPVDKSDTWVYFSDTPQGAVDGLEDNLYLTNATHTTQDSTGSTSTTVTDNTGTVTTDTNTDNTGTVTTETDTDNTRTYNTQNPGTSQNTRTYNTQNPTTTENTRTYNTTNTISSNKNTNLTSTQEYAEHVIGKFPGKSYSKLLMEFRETFLNIDLMVIRELSDLFFGLWE